MDILQMLGQVKTPQDEALARQVISAMLGSAAAQPVPNQGPARTPEEARMAQITASFRGEQQIPSPDFARQLLVAAATPTPTQQESASVVKDSPITQALPQVSPQDAVLAASTKLAELEQGSRVSDILSALPVWSASQDAAERVNANTSVYGVKATKDAQGRVTLSNVVDGQVTPQSQPKSFNPMASGMSSKISAMLDEINKAEDTATAMGKAAPLREALIEETTRMQNTALEQAEAELGLPKLRRALQASQAADQMLPNWSPALGDSPNTAKVRGQIAAVEAQVKQKASDWLSRNITFRQLQETSRSAEAAIELATTKSRAAEQRMEATKARKEELETIKYESLPPSVRMLVSRLNPDISKQSDPAAAQAAVVAFDEREAKRSKDYLAVRESAPEDYPTLAFAGNKLAAQILLEDEEKATGIPRAILEQEFQAAANSSVGAEDIKSFVSASLGTKDAAAVQAQIGQLNSLKMDGKEGARKYAEVEARIRQAKVKRVRENMMFDDILSWAPDGSSLQMAAKKVKDTTGEATLHSTLAELLKDKPLEEQTVLVNSVRDALSMHARKFGNSAYGKPDAGIIKDRFNRMILDMGYLQNSAKNYLAAHLAMGPLGSLVPGGLTYINWMDQKRQKAVLGIQ